MNNLIKEISKCRFSLKEYNENHCSLTLSAVNMDDSRIKYKVYFADVSYIKMPLGWVGGFDIGSDNEREEIISKTGLPIIGFSSAVKLYKSNQDEVLILGALMGIELERSFEF